MIPTVPHVPQPPSAEAREVGTKIAELVRILRADNPSIGPDDVRRGLQLAESELRSEIGGTSKTVLALVLALIAGCGVVVAVYSSSPDRGVHVAPFLIMGLVVLLALVALAVRSK